MVHNHEYLFSGLFLEYSGVRHRINEFKNVHRKTDLIFDENILICLVLQWGTNMETPFKHSPQTPVKALLLVKNQLNGSNIDSSVINHSNSISSRKTMIPKSTFCFIFDLSRILLSCLEDNFYIFTKTIAKEVKVNLPMKTNYLLKCLQYKFKIS